MRNVRLIMMASGLALLPLAGMAQSIEKFHALSPEDRQTYMQSMSPDERRAMRDKWRAEMESKSDAERAAAREQRKQRTEQRRQKWESMSEEERAAMRQRRSEHRQGRQGKREQSADDS